MHFQGVVYTLEDSVVCYMYTRGVVNSSPGLHMYVHPRGSCYATPARVLRCVVTAPGRQRRHLRSKLKESADYAPIPPVTQHNHV